MILMFIMILSSIALLVVGSSMLSSIPVDATDTLKKTRQQQAWGAISAGILLGLASCYGMYYLSTDPPDDPPESLVQPLVPLM
jgi:hypothetical protein